MTESNKSSDKGVWLIYLSLIAAAVLLLGDGLGIAFLARLTTRLGATILLSALFLIVGDGRPTGFIATAIMAIAFVITIFQ
jgi:uncharacterized membrane protein